MELQVGQTFAQRYRVERLLARGGMGAVYVAQQLSTEAAVALKVLDPRMLESESQRKAFKVEATVAGRVRSQHIVRTLDAGVDDATGLPYLVMELLEGTPLDEVIEQRGRLPAATVVSYVSQVATGLDRAHAHTVDGKPQPIVHRDLKPNNLMLTHRDDGQPEIKILDFGIAKLVGHTTTGVSREIKGTPSFMAFEQAAGERVTPQTDIWALGLIAFYLLTGKSYWRSASSPEGTLESLLGEVLALPLSPATERMRALGVEPEWPVHAFDAWFARCVHRDPSQRFASAGLAAQALRKALIDPVTPKGWDANAATTETLLSQPPAIARAHAAAAAGARDPSSATGVGERSVETTLPRARWPQLVLVALALLLLGAALWLAGPASEPAAQPVLAPGAQPTPDTPTAPTATPATMPPPTLPSATPAPSPTPAAGSTQAAGGAAASAPAPGTPTNSPRGRTSRTRAAASQAAAPAAAPAPTPAAAPSSPAPVPQHAPGDLYNRR